MRQVIDSMQVKREPIRYEEINVAYERQRTRITGLRKHPPRRDRYGVRWIVCVWDDDMDLDHQRFCHSGPYLDGFRDARGYRLDVAVCLRDLAGLAPKTL